MRVAAIVVLGYKKGEGDKARRAKVASAAATAATAARLICNTKNTTHYHQTN